MGKLGYIVRCIAHMDYSALFDTVKQVHKTFRQTESGYTRRYSFLRI